MLRPLLLLLLLAGGDTLRVRPSLARSLAPRMGLFDEALDSLKENFREVKVQHVLVSNQADALEIYEAILEEGASSATVGKFAAARSTCGSAKKKPDASLAQLRGAPGELKFRRGVMAKEFESAAFDAAPGTLVRPFRTQFGWHVMYVNE